MEKECRVLFIGGHLAPALAVIEELQSRGKWEIFWVGRRFAMETLRVPSLEYEIIPKLGITFFDLKTGRLQRHFSGETVFSLFRVIPGLFQAIGIIMKVRPSIVVSFGGYLSVPVVFSAFLLKIPILIHEQTAVSGLANRFAALFATKIAISYPESARDFPKGKTVLTGNPVSKSVLSIKRQKTKRPVVYITGGGQGSQIINKAIRELLPRLSKRFSIIHQTGTLSYPEFSALTKQFKNYIVKGTFSRSEVVEIYKRASLVISRGGANTIAEIAVVGIPGVIIPIPRSERDEQQKNAELLSQTGLAILLPQKDLTKESLFGAINYLISNPPPDSCQTLARRLVNPKAAVLLSNIMEELTA